MELLALCGAVCQSGAADPGVPPKFNLTRGAVVVAVFCGNLILPYPSPPPPAKDEDEILLDI
jgi:hypothetical protein